MRSLKHVFLSIAIAMCLAADAATVKNLPGSIGAEITEIDFSLGITVDEVQMIRQLAHERLVVIVRDQNLSADQQTFITSQFGDVEIAWDKKNRHPDNPCVHVITNDEAKKNPNYRSSTYFWHWDKSFIQYPTSFSFAFFPTESQPDGIGTTGFVNAYAIYETLPEDLKQKIEHLSVIHSYDIMANLRRENYEKASLEFKKGNEKFPNVVHPLVGVHPATGRRTLNVDTLSQGALVGLSEEESARLRKTLFDHAMQQECFYFHNWKKGDFVLWDNLALMHRGVPSDPSITRILHRTNISSRPEIEGQCILIASDLQETDLSAVSGKLFAEPLFLDADSYEDLLALEGDVECLRKGCKVKRGESFLNPHAIVMLKGKKWKESQRILSWLHGCVLRDCSGSMIPKKVRVIPHSNECGIELENFCMEHYVIQDTHERLMNGELSFDFLQKKMKILVSSYRTYSDENEGFLKERELVHAKILARAFAHTDLKKSNNEWFEFLQSIKQTGIQGIKAVGANTPWLLFLGGGQGAGKTTLLKQLQGSNLVEQQTVVVNSHLFFDSLFNDVPYAHKVQLWPHIADEKRYLTILIAKIAIAHQIPVVVDTHILSKDFCRALTDAVREYGGESLMIALSAPLDICDLREQTSSESQLKEANRLVYEQMLFHKVFATNWSEFIQDFDVSFLIDQNAGQEISPILFLSEKSRSFLSSIDHMKQFLDLSCIDPDELANEIGVLDLEQGYQSIQKYLQRISTDKAWKFMPKGAKIVEQCQLSEQSSDIAKALETLFRKPTLR